MISIYNLGYQIAGQTILDGVELSVRQGECFVLMGPSGCGKSTLLRLLIGLIQPTSGWVEIEGQNTLTLSKKEWRQVRAKMGMVFQSSALFDSLTIYENVAFGLRRKGLPEKELRRRVYESLAIVGLAENVAARMPADLSGGMKKRTAIARAVAFRPPILLYDEPTTGLDPIIADTINDLIRQLQQQLGVTSIVVTHDMNSALKIADRVGLLYRGRLEEVCERKDLHATDHPVLQQFLKNYQV